MSKQGSGKRPLQERIFEIVVNHIAINEDQLPQVSQQSVAALNWPRALLALCQSVRKMT